MNFELEEIYKIVSEQTNTPIDIIRNIYNRYWFYIKKRIENLKLKNKTELPKEYFDTNQTCFALSKLGELHCTYEDYLKKRNTNAVNTVLEKESSKNTRKLRKQRLLKKFEDLC